LVFNFFIKIISQRFIYPYTFQNTPTPNFGVGDEWKAWIFPPGLPLHQNWRWGLIPGGEGVWIYFGNNRQLDAH